MNLKNKEEVVSFMQGIIEKHDKEGMLQKAKEQLPQDKPPVMVKQHQGSLSKRYDCHCLQCGHTYMAEKESPCQCGNNYFFRLDPSESACEGVMSTGNASEVVYFDGEIAVLAVARITKYFTAKETSNQEGNFEMGEGNYWTHISYHLFAPNAFLGDSRFTRAHDGPWDYNSPKSASNKACFDFLECQEANLMPNDLSQKLFEHEGITPGDKAISEYFKKVRQVAFPSKSKGFAGFKSKKDLIAFVHPIVKRHNSEEMLERAHGFLPEDMFPITCIPRTDPTVTMFDCHCFKCGHTYVSEGAARACPQCGLDNLSVIMHNNWNKFQLAKGNVSEVIYADDNIAVLATAEISKYMSLYEGVESKNYERNADEYAEGVCYSVCTADAFYGDKTFGSAIRSYDISSWDILPLKSDKNQNLIKLFSNGWKTLMPSASAEIFFKRLGITPDENALKEYFTGLKESFEKAPTAVPAPLPFGSASNDMKEYSPDELKELFIKEYGHMCCITPLKEGGYAYKCVCGEAWESEKDNEMCPHGPSYNVLIKSSEIMRGLYVVEYDENKEAFIWRGFDILFSNDENYDGPFKSKPLVPSVKEVARAIMTSRSISYFRCGSIQRGDDFELGFKKVQELPPMTAVYVTDKAKDAYSNSFLKFSGAAEFWEKETEIPWALGKKTYLGTWLKNPGVELIAKCNLPRILEDVLHGASLRSGSDVCSVLGITKPVLKMAQEENLSLMNTHMLSQLWEADQSLTIKDIRKLKSVMTPSELDMLNRIMSDIVKILGMCGGKAKDVIGYLVDNAYKKQYIHINEAITVWLKYLNLCGEEARPLKKDAKYPDSLRRALDSVVFARESHPEMNGNYEDILQRVSYLTETPENSEYVIVLPSSPLAAIKEGMALNNCLRHGGYTAKMNTGESIIVFIRKASEPQKSLYAAEIHDGAIIQFMQEGNKEVVSKSAKAFLYEWAMMHHLKKDC